MSASNAKSDTIQILAFTFFLCAIFFGAWGGYMHWKVKKLQVKRNKSVATIKKFEKNFADAEVMEQVDNWRRKQDIIVAQDSDAGISTIVQNVINKMPRNARPIIKRRNNQHKDDEKAGIRELSTSLELDPTSLKTLVYFVQQLEDDDYGLDITKTSFSRRRPKRGEDANKPADIWNTEQFKISTLIPIAKPGDE